MNHPKLKLATVAALILAAALPSTGLAAKPLKVFILAGQSNMDGQAAVRTIDFLAEDPEPARAALLKVFKPDGKNYVTRDDVWVASGGVHDKLQTGYGGRKNHDKLGEKIGPEYSFGYYMGAALDEPVLLIKYGPGGQSLFVNFRPPSAGLPDPVPTKTLPDKTKVPMVAEDFGGQYRALIGIVHETLGNLKKHFPGYDETAGYEVAGLVWFQGFNDLVNGPSHISEYEKNLTCLIKDLRKEFKAPQMKAVVGVIGVNGVLNEVGKMKDLRDAMRDVGKVPEFQGNVKAVESAPLLDSRVVALQTAGWLNKDREDSKKVPFTPEEAGLLQRATSDKGFHYYGEGRFFILLGKAFAEAMLELMKQ